MTGYAGYCLMVIIMRGNGRIPVTPRSGAGSGHAVSGVALCAFITLMRTAHGHTAMVGDINRSVTFEA